MLGLFNPKATQPDVVMSLEIQALLEQRTQAKKDKNFALADQIRDQLKGQYQMQIVDTPNGPTVKPC
jgi:cysteinyl-tRNA synthetase